jgi:pimeloyl-ACP methyl ester carboxylesterase
MLGRENNKVIYCKVIYNIVRSMTMNDMKFEGFAGLEIAASVSGPGDGFPVLLAHGGGQTRRAWKRVVGELGVTGYRAIAIDLRGHGDSEWASDGAYDMRDFAADLVAISEQLDRRPALVGASLGGIAGMIAAGELAPDSFASLTLVDIAPKMEESGVSRVVGFMQAHVDDGFGSPEEAANVIAEYLPHRPERKSSGNLNRYLRRRDDGRYYWHWDPKFIKNVTKSRNDSSEARDGGLNSLSEAVSKLTLPVHLIRGGSSDLVSEDTVAHLRELVPDAHYTDIAGAGHMVVGDRNDAFCSAIFAFLDQIHGKERAL